MCKAQAGRDASCQVRCMRWKWCSLGEADLRSHAVQCGGAGMVFIISGHRFAGYREVYSREREEGRYLPLVLAK